MSDGVKGNPAHLMQGLPGVHWLCIARGAPRALLCPETSRTRQLPMCLLHMLWNLLWSLHEPRGCLKLPRSRQECILRLQLALSCMLAVSCLLAVGCMLRVQPILHVWRRDRDRQRPAAC